MGDVDGFEAERAFDLEETIFVAVGKNVEKSRRLLFWVLQSFAGKKICLLYVHQPANVVSLTDRKLAVNELKEDAVKAFQGFETKTMHDVLDQYCLILAQEGVQADKVWIEMDNIEKGIVEIISQCNIRWLVMGAAADKYYSKKLGELKSKKAIFVCQQAPTFCHIWFVCRGCLIYTREGRYYRSEAEVSLPLLLPSSDSDTEQLRILRSESLTQLDRSLDAEEVADDLGGILGRFDRYPVHSCQSTNTILSNSKFIPLLADEEEKTQMRTTEETCSRLEKAIMDANDSKKKALVEALNRWKEEDNAMEAKCKAKALENLCVKEISLRKETEEALDRKKQEVEKTKNQRDEFLKELQMVKEDKCALESQIAESQHMVEELEEKIISAVQLLISFKERRDAARVEYENAIQEVRRLNISAKAAAAGWKSELLELSFMEINEATHNFDPSRKIGEGRYGSVYKGLLRHLFVAIKMFSSYSSQCLLDFQNGVEILSRVRHPNLVTLVGTCPESRSLVYEYVRNGSLEDHLSCKDKKPPLPWQTRIRIAVQICSSLTFLHSNKPCIIHGNLKPSKVLLDANFVSKLTDFGIFHLIPRSESTSNSTGLCNKSTSNFTSLYVDPEYLESGMPTPESDVYSFGIILLQLLTGRAALDIVKDVKFAIEKENFKALLDCSGGDWPFEEALQLANLALRCCEKNRLDRPDLVLILRVLEPMKTSCFDSGPKEPRRAPSNFVCPILQEVMDDPQIAADGFTYDAEAIRGWLKSGHDTSPMTNLKLEHSNLLPNHALHQAILEWKQPVKPVNSITDVMRPEEGNDSSLDTVIKDAIGKQPLLSFSRPNDNPVQWIQLLHALDQPDYPGWPLLTPLKVQMQKCSKCSREFCSSINYRRHLRVHHRLKRLDKDSANNKDSLGAFWDKLSEDKAKEILSFKDVTLEEVPGSSIIKSLTAVIRKPGISSLTQSCWRAGSALLDLVQGRPSRFPLPSGQLFSILDDASEKTFLCGPAVLIQKYIFDGGAGKIGLETKNIVACTSFVVEQKLIKAWLADQDAEALRCQKLLVEEEEAAQRRQAELLERKRQKKLRHKELKAKEQRQDEKVDVKERIDDTLEAVPQAEQSCPLPISDSDTLGSETLPDDVPSSLEPFQLPRTDEDVDLENQIGHGGGHSMLQGSSHSHIVVARWHASSKSQRNHLSNGFHASQNSQAPKPGTMQKHGIQRDFKPGPIVYGNRKWSRKPKPESNGESLEAIVQKEAITEPDHDKKGEVLIGSISVTLGNCSHDESNNLDGAQDDSLVEHEIPKKNNVQEKHNRPDSVQCGTNRPTVKLWRPVSRNGTKSLMLAENGHRECQLDIIGGKGEDQILCNDSSVRSCAMDDSFGGMENGSLLGDLCPGGLQFSSHEAKVFLAERWKEAIAAEHVKLALSPEYQVAANRSSDIRKQDVIGCAENQLVDVEAQESSTTGAGKPKFKTKPDKGVKLKYIPKQ
ncbi:unnamed protein product [Dovyalis caffra]|uniref:Uncharacterized protein n=1 Tax=Dovyalis caffra TaxID=77055 RepID=A0AAV1RPI0_9ROSI|nr:unnamed protein product [Dovyalis caffra]